MAYPNPSMDEQVNLISRWSTKGSANGEEESGNQEIRQRQDKVEVSQYDWQRVRVSF
jgi:hypothetical protein